MYYHDHHLYPDKEKRITQIMEERGYTRTEAEEVVDGVREEIVLEHHGITYFCGTYIPENKPHVVEQ